MKTIWGSLFFSVVPFSTTIEPCSMLIDILRTSSSYENSSLAWLWDYNLATNYLWSRMHLLWRAGIWWQFFTPTAAVSKPYHRFYPCILFHPLGASYIVRYSVLRHVYSSWAPSCLFSGYIIAVYSLRGSNFDAATRTYEAEPRRLVLGDVSSVGYWDRSASWHATLAGCCFH